MKQDFIDFIKKQDLFDLANDRVLLAVSAGIDSVALAHLMADCKCTFAIAHCNFGLRAEDSQEDMLFVKKLAKKFDVPFFVEHFNTEDFAKKSGMSIQMAARKLRYDWLQLIAQTNDYQYIATGHQQQDVLETVLLNITHGTGVDGLIGMRPKNGNILRPLLFAQKEQIYEYVVEKQIVWREDLSNQTNKYGRNLIRNEVLPLLNSLNPNLLETFVGTARRFELAVDLLHEKIEALEKKCLQVEPATTTILLDELKDEKHFATCLYYLLKKYGFSYKTVVQLASSILENNIKTGARFFALHYQLTYDRNRLIVSASADLRFTSITLDAGALDGQQTILLTNNKSLNFNVLDAETYTITSNEKIAALDLDLIKFPLKIRKWQAGDWFVPLGLNSKQKISDFLINKKISLVEKESIFLLESDGAIAWIVGQRIDNRFKISTKTKKVLEVSLN